MSNTNDWKKLLETGAGNVPNTSSAGANQANANAQAKVDMNTTAVDPSAITKSYYNSPLTKETYESQSRPVYQQSQGLQNAADRLSQHEANKPGAYESQYNNQIQGLIDNILNREKFSYDYSTDPMYQQYAQQYQRGGQMAMKDAMAESAALTGGYGNSYAQQVGQQTYQQYMEDLSNVIPELRNAAYNMYVDEGNAMRDNLGLLQTEDERGYNRYRDQVGDWQNELNYFYTVFSDMSAEEYQRYMNDTAAWEADRAYWYQKAHDDRAFDYQKAYDDRAYEYQKNYDDRAFNYKQSYDDRAFDYQKAYDDRAFDYQKAYDAQQQANWEKQFEAIYGPKLSSGGGSSGGSSSGSKKKQETEDVIYIPSGSNIGSSERAETISAVEAFREKMKNKK